MTIVIKRGFHNCNKKESWNKRKRGRRSREKKIQDLCGVLKNQISDDPVISIRKCAMKEWS